MADEVTSEEIRIRRFDVVRKGYDRNQVEVFLAQVARQFDVLESHAADASDSEISVGVDDPEALARELASIGGEIGAILEAARSAAEGMRSRAAADADSWTSDAKAHVEASTSDAKEQAMAARGSAWDVGSSMLADAREQAARMVADAETDALRIRAEAEREAIRYTNDAKRTGEEAIGAAESEAEGILSTSRAESERVMRAANQSAELAQERARALEDRRSELLVELESTRSSIGDLENEFESRRQELEEPEPVAVPEYEDRSHHDTDGGTVKIIAGSKVVPLKPVDADSFVAEVAEMQMPEEERTRQPSAVSYIPEREESGTPPVVSDEETVSHQPEAESVEPSDMSIQAEDEQSVETSDASIQAEDQESGQPPVLIEEVSRPEEVDLPPVSEPQVDQPATEPVVDPIGSLFAQLREGSDEPMVDSPQSEEGSEPLMVDGSQSEEESEQSTVDRSQPDAENGEQGTDTASLIPVQNAALRAIKRQLVDLQNDALEHLRTDESWNPTEEFTDRFSEPFSELAIAITNDGEDGGAASVFATDLYDAVSNAVTGTREAGSGDRAIAAATSKVFRTWRSDEAERRVVAAASDFSENQ